VGTLVQMQGQPERAACLLAVAAALRTQTGGASYHTLTAAIDYEQAIATVRVLLGEQIFAARWAEGQAMTLEDAIAFAVATTGATDVSPVVESEKAATPAPLANLAGLTLREIEVLRLLVQGLTYAQIADKLVVSRRTVNAHATAIYSKLGVTSRAMAARLAVEQRLV
jgi:DNA-binding NarL/FixJ family response regulator